MALYRVDFQGTIYGIETFQHGMHFSSSDSTAGVAADADAAFTTLLGDTDWSTYFTTGIVWSQLNVSELGATPASPIVTSAQATLGIAGASTDPGLPAQCSPCVSLTTAIAGSRARGRMFLPPPDTSVLTGSGRLSAQFRTDVITCLDTFYASMAANAATPVVVSAVGGVWTTYTVNTIRLGDVVDTQRRRRNSIAEVYTTAAI
jgi:hypothetical protein